LAYRDSRSTILKEAKMATLHKGDPIPVGPGYRMDGSGPSELEEWLTKKAEDDPQTSTETDETKSTVGVVNLYENPPEEAQAPSGDGKSVHSDAAEKSHEEVRPDAVGSLFDSKAVADQADTKLLSENIRHVASGDFETHSLHLRNKAKTKTSAARVKHVTEEGTLGMRVKDLLGSSNG
jgi:hypothetical protein